MSRLPFFLLFAFVLSSCSVLDYPARVAGFSIQKFENEQNGRFEQSFEMTKKDGFNKTLAIIDYLTARVTHKSFSKGYIVAFDFSKSFDYCLDSTEAAFFIEEVPGGIIKTTVVSNNSLLARMLSEKYFTLMAAKPEEKEIKK